MGLEDKGERKGRDDSDMKNVTLKKKRRTTAGVKRCKVKTDDVIEAVINHMRPVSLATHRPDYCQIC